MSGLTSFTPELIIEKELQHTTPLQFWHMVHSCHSTCNCITTPDGNEAVIDFNGVRVQGNGRNLEESTEIALYKLFYNHFELTLRSWSRFWLTNLEFPYPIPNFEQTKQQIHGNDL